MGIRVTNSMVTKNAMSNININKSSLSTLNTQMVTQKKIARPSEDPITAIRSLRLRNSLNEITQHYERNIPDAQSWLELTDSTLNSIKNVMQTMYYKCEQGASGENTTADRKIILEELQNLSKQIYAEANADYAGRTLLSGYYTNRDVVFPADTEDTHYRISETLSASDISSFSYISNKTDFDLTNPTLQSAANMPKDNEVTRIRLGYGELDKNQAMKLEYRKIATGFTSTREDDGTVKVQGNTIKTTLNDDGTKTVTVNSDVFNIDKTGRVVPAAGNSGNVSVVINSAGNIETTIADNSLSEGIAPNTTNKSFTIETSVAGRQVGDIFATYTMDVEIASVSMNEDDAYLKFNDAVPIHVKCVAETGELILDDVAKKELLKLEPINGEEPITFTYDKTGFDRYELVPEQYFDCIDLTDPDNPVSYVKQSADIEYSISFNQELKVNVEASDAFDHGTNRDIQELMQLINESLEIENTMAEIEAMLESPQHKDHYTELRSMLEAAQRQSDIANEKVRVAYQSNISSFQSYLDKIEQQITDTGSRLNRLTIVENRMEEQQSNFQELKSKNEDKDLEQIMIEYQSAYTAYQAALSATSKLSQNTLLDFI